MCFTIQKAIIFKIILAYILFATAFSCPNIFGQENAKSHRVVIKESQQIFAKEKRSIDRAYHSYVEKLNDGYQKKVQTLRKQVIQYLEKARDQLAKRVDLSGANEVQKEIDSYLSIPIQLPLQETAGSPETAQLVKHQPATNETINAMQQEIERLRSELKQTSRNVAPENAHPFQQVLTSRSRGLVPIDAVRFNGHSYKLYGKGFPFSAAARICAQKGGHLVVIDSLEELEFLRQLAARNPYKVDQFWVNATDDMKEGDWRTVDGRRLPLIPWGPNEPSNTAGKGGQEHYASMSREANWLLNDNQGVYRSYGFICEWDD